MRKVSIDFLKQQVRTFWVESWEVRVFLWGGHVPPHASDFYRFPLWGLSVPVPFLLVYLLLFLLRLLPAPSGLVALILVVGSSTGGALHLRPPVYSRTPSPLTPPLPPLLPWLPPPLTPQMCWACCDVAGVWPLAPSPPGGKLIIWATIAPACSSGAPLPPNGGGAPSPTLYPLWASSLSPPPLFCFTVGEGLLRSWGFPRISSPSIRLEVGGGLLSSWGSSRISCIRLRTKGVHACSGGGPLSPSG